ncbi:hypothetical protein D3C81_1735260 [compost metagenome]
MCQHLGQYQKRQGVRRKDPLFERAVLEIAAEKPVQREQHGQQGRHPDQAGGKALQQLGLGAHGQREQCDHYGEEHQGIGQFRRTAHQQARFAGDQQGKDVAHARRCPRSSSR